MVQVSTLTFKAGSKTLIDQLSFTAQRRELLAILGANGAGKSTLMKLLCRELKPFKGDIKINQQPLNDYKLAQLARTRAVLAQHHTLSVSFLAEELVMMGRYPHFDHQPTANDEKIVKQVMQQTGITHLTGRDYHTLSGGEQQRVQLARVIAQVYDCPDACLFLDEPTNGLDIQYQQQIMVLARALADEGYCVICILHDINYAARFADRILMLKDGKKVVEGTPREVVTQKHIFDTFNIKVKLMDCEGFDCPLVIPAILDY